MSANIPQDVTTMEQLETALRHELQQAKKSQRHTLIVSAILALFMLAYLSWMFTQVGELVDERTLAGIFQVEVRKRIPLAQEKLRNAILTTLPGLVDRGFDMVIANLPEWREDLANEFTRRLDIELSKKKKQFDQRFKEELTAARKAAIRKHLKDLSEFEQRQLIEKELEVRLTVLYQEQVEKVVGQFIKRIEAFDLELQSLSNTDPARLAPAQKEKLEMVLCLTAYLEKLFAEEGDLIIERILQVSKSSAKSIQFHFSSQIPEKKRKK